MKVSYCGVPGDEVRLQLSYGEACDLADDLRDRELSGTGEFLSEVLEAYVEKYDAAADLTELEAKGGS